MDKRIIYGKPLIKSMAANSVINVNKYGWSFEMITELRDYEKQMKLMRQFVIVGYALFIFFSFKVIMKATKFPLSTEDM